MNSLGLSSLAAEEPASAEKPEAEKKHDDHKHDDDHEHDDAKHEHEGEDGHGSHSPIGEKEAGSGLVPGTPDEHGNISPWRLDLSLYSLAVFIVLLVIMGKYAWGPIVEALDEREEGIRKNIESAQQVKEQSEAMLAQYQSKLDSAQDEVRGIIAEAKRDAEHTKKEIEEKAAAEAKLVLDRADHEIDRAKGQALDQLFETLSGQVSTATEQVIGRSLTDEDRERLVGEAIAGFSAQS